MFIHRKPEAVPELTTQNEDRAISFEILREYVHGYNIMIKPILRSYNWGLMGYDGDICKQQCDIWLRPNGDGLQLQTPCLVLSSADESSPCGVFLGGPMGDQRIAMDTQWTHEGSLLPLCFCCPIFSICSRIRGAFGNESAMFIAFFGPENCIYIIWRCPKMGVPQIIQVIRTF